MDHVDEGSLNVPSTAKRKHNSYSAMLGMQIIDSLLPFNDDGSCGLQIPVGPTSSDGTTNFTRVLEKRNWPNMKTPTEKAMDVLKDSMVQMRHDVVEEIKDGLRGCIHDLADHVFEKYIVIDRQTRQPVESEDCDLMTPINDSEWYQHEILELLKRNEDDALEQMTWIAEPEHAPDGCAPNDRFTAHLPDVPIPTTCVPVGRDEYIQGIEELGKSSLVQEAILRRAFEYLQAVTNTANQATAAQEAQSIAKVKHLIHTQWVREARKAYHMYVLLMRGRGQGIDGRAIEGMDTS